MGLCSVLIALAASLGAPLEIAYLARYYTPPNSKVRSHYHLYLTDLHGKRKIQVSRDDEFWSFRWLDPNTLAWGPKSGTWHTYDVATGKRGTSPKPEEPKEPAGELWRGNSGEVRFPGEPPIQWSDFNEGRDYTFTRSKKTIRYVTEPESNRLCRRLFPAGPNKTYLVANEGSANGMYDEDFLYLLDWRKGKLKLIRRGGKEMKVDAGRDLMVCLQKDRNLTDFGEPGRTIWTGELYAMQLSKNKLWPIVKGLVSVTSFAVRPAPTKKESATPKSNPKG